MKSILKTALVGLLLVAGTTKPIATLDQVKAALISLIPADGKIIDKTLIDNLGNLDVSYAWWLSSQINKLLADNPLTKKCTIRNGLGGLLFYVKTLDASHTADTAVKLIVVTEDGCQKTTCGIQFNIAADRSVTATYKSAADTAVLLEKSCVRTERCYVSVSQLAMGTLAWTLLGTAAVVGIGYAGYHYNAYSVNLAKIETLKSVEELLAKRGIKLVEDAVKETPKTLSASLYEAAQRVIGSIGTSAPKAAVEAPRAIAAAVLPKV